MKTDKIYILACACCGSAAPAKRQWFNQDTGYGLCPKCADWITGKEGEEYTNHTYGKPGIHYFTKSMVDNLPDRIKEYI